MLTALAFHIYHALLLVLPAETSHTLCGQVEAWSRCAPLMLTALAYHIHHALLLVLPAETSHTLFGQVEDWLCGASLICTMFFLDVV